MRSARACSETDGAPRPGGASTAAAHAPAPPGADLHVLIFLFGPSCADLLVLIFSCTCLRLSPAVACVRALRCGTRAPGPHGGWVSCRAPHGPKERKKDLRPIPSIDIPSALPGLHGATWAHGWGGPVGLRQCSGPSAHACSRDACPASSHVLCLLPCALCLTKAC